MATGLTADLRQGGELPEGLELVGGEASFEEQEDGSQALVLPEGGYLRISLPAVSPWSLEDDGRFHRWSFLLAVRSSHHPHFTHLQSPIHLRHRLLQMRVDRLPAATLQLFNGGGPPAQGEQLEHVQVYKNGGVGCLGQMGTQEAAVRAERWAWLTITRKEGELRTYVNGRLCAEVKLVSAKEEAQKKKEEEAKRKKADGGGRDPDGDGADGGRRRRRPRREQVKLRRRSSASTRAARALRHRRGRRRRRRRRARRRGRRARHLRPVRQARVQMLGRRGGARRAVDQRGRDEEAELDADADEARARDAAATVREASSDLAAPGLRRRVWRRVHRGHRLEHGSMHISLEVFVLALQRMLAHGGKASETLAHHERSALNTACSLLDDAKKVAHKLAHAASHAGQERLYLGKVLRALERLEPAASVVLPCLCGGNPILFVIQRYATPREGRCTFTVVSCDPDEIPHHRASAEPPKIKMQTALEIRDVSIAKLQDEAFWGVLWFAALSDDGGKLSALQLLYELALSFLADASLDQAMIHTDAATAAAGDRAPEMRTPRRSASSHYGCVRHALRYVLRLHGVAEASCRKISLLLRLQLLEMAYHDLAFVRACRRPSDRSPHRLPSARVQGRQARRRAARVGARRRLELVRRSAAADAPAHLGGDVGGAREDCSRQEEARLPTGRRPHRHRAAAAHPLETDAHLGRPSLATLLATAPASAPRAAAGRRPQRRARGGRRRRRRGRRRRRRRRRGGGGGGGGGGSGGARARGGGGGRRGARALLLPPRGAQRAAAPAARRFGLLGDPIPRPPAPDRLRVPGCLGGRV